MQEFNESQSSALLVRRADVHNWAPFQAENSNTDEADHFVRCVIDTALGFVYYPAIGFREAHRVICALRLARASTACFRLTFAELVDGTTARPSQPSPAGSPARAHLTARRVAGFMKTDSDQGRESPNPRRYQQPDGGSTCGDPKDVRGMLHFSPSKPSSRRPLWPSAHSGRVYPAVRDGHRNSLIRWPATGNQNMLYSCLLG